MYRSLSRALVCLFPVALLAPAVQADATLRMQEVGGRADAVIEVKGHMMRMSTPGQSDYLLYDAQRDTAIHVNSGEGQYTEFDRATLEKMAATMEMMAPQMAMMREQLKNLPPEQRAMIERQMGGMANLGAMESKPAVAVTTIKRGSDTIAGFDCRRYQVLNDKVPVADVCVATEADAGMSKAEFATVSAAMKFMRDMAERAQKLSINIGAPQMSIGDVEGVPVSVKDLRNGREFRLADVSDKALGEARFNAYRSLNKRALPNIR